MTGVSLGLAQRSASSAPQPAAAALPTDPAALLAYVTTMLNSPPPGEIRHVKVHVETLYVSAEAQRIAGPDFFGDDWEAWLGSGRTDLLARFETTRQGQPIVEQFGNGRYEEFDGDLGTVTTGLVDPAYTATLLSARWLPLANVISPRRAGSSSVNGHDVIGVTYDVGTALNGPCQIFMMVTVWFDSASGAPVRFELAARRGVEIDANGVLDVTKFESVPAASLKPDLFAFPAPGRVSPVTGPTLRPILPARGC